ncbi:Cro/CI family transcriptional regulator [Enterobacter sp. ASE]|uniref:Cro/CI family transcriptional regulator n=1 Tax=Enterobacter sp. ASE TaxID=2905968 RepID=UPI001E51DAB6|nr:Cro/CI family transcriptional regulator [Enterobacter sp. ASE]MCE3116155.1 Cro/CI family transcriptional regulator [Enterobacter sp. ASE]
MYKEEAIKVFGNKSRVAFAAGVDPSAVSQWKTLVPERCAQRLADASGGALHYDKNVYDEYRKKKRQSRKNNTESQEKAE